MLKNGQLIGLSGASNDGVSHLPFGICKIAGSSERYSQTYDPQKFWLDGRPKCFDPHADYSKFFREAITLPLACKAYAKDLITAADDLSMVVRNVGQAICYNNFKIEIHGKYKIIRQKKLLNGKRAIFKRMGQS